MSYSYANDVSEHSYYSPSAIERTPSRGRNGFCNSRPSTSRLPFSSNFVPSSVEKRIILPQFARNTSLDNRITTFGTSNSAILESSIPFVPAKRPFETDTKELRTKYICLTGRNSGPFAAESGQNGEIRAYPTSNGIPKLLNGNSSSSPTVDSGTSGVAVSSRVPTPLFDIFPADGVRLQWDTELRCSTSVGLNNMGNTCFLNSVLQVLTNTPPLANYLLGQDHDSQKCGLSLSGSYCALCLMKSHVRRIFSNANNGHESITPNGIASKIRSFMKSHALGRQEDAHEFLRYFVDAMQSATLYPFKDQKLDLFTKETSVISRIFGGYHKNEIVCNNCHSSSVTYDPFLDLNVEIKQSSSLETALSHFTSVEILSSDNAYQCPKCSRRVSAKKIFTIFQAPNVLTIQLKRFDHFGKIDRLITYPDRLNLRPYMTEKQGPPVNYRLYGVIVHVGRTTHSGHYYAFVRNPCDQWHVMDDSRVTPALAQSALRISAAYVLFYMRMPTPIASVKPQTKPFLGFIGPERPIASPLASAKSELEPEPEPAKSDDTIPKPGFKGTFSEIRATPAGSSTLGNVRPAFPAGSTRPLTPIVARPIPLINPAIRVQPLRFRLTSKKNGIPSQPVQGQGAVDQKPPLPPSAKQIILKISRPIQDSSVSSSTKLVPYDYDDDEEEGKCEEMATANTLPYLVSAKSEVADGTELSDAKVESTASPK